MNVYAKNLEETLPDDNLWINISDKAVLKNYSIGNTFDDKIKYHYFSEQNSITGKKNFYLFTQYEIIIFFKNGVFKYLSVSPKNLSGYNGGYFLHVDCDDILQQVKNICDLKKVNAFLNDENSIELKTIKKLKVSDTMLRVGTESNFLEVVGVILEANHYSDDFINSVKQVYIKKNSGSADFYTN